MLYFSIVYRWQRGNSWISSCFNSTNKVHPTREAEPAFSSCQVQWGPTCSAGQTSKRQQHHGGRQAASTNNPSRSSNTRKSLSDHLKRKSNNVVRPTIGRISSYAHLVEMEINKMKIECHKRELEISTLEHTQKMRAEQERKKCWKSRKETEKTGRERAGGVRNSENAVPKGRNSNI